MTQDKREHVGGHAGSPKVVPLVRLAKEPRQTFSNRLVIFLSLRVRLSLVPCDG